MNSCNYKNTHLNQFNFLGYEFKCPELAALFKSYNIHHYFSYSDKKCAIIERFNLTLQELIYKIMDYTNSYRWIDHLQQAVQIYHSRIHSTIKMTPLKAELKTSQRKLRKIYNLKYGKMKKIKPRFAVGDSVRVAAQRTKFQRGYLQQFNEEPFVISKVLTNLPIPRYELKDGLNNIILGHFFDHELVKYKAPVDKLWRIEEILRYRKNPISKRQEVLVKWVGFDKRHNSWVDQSQIENI